LVFKKKIRYRQNIVFKSFDNDQVLEINKNDFWETFLNQDYGEFLIVADNDYELEITGATFGDKFLKYFDKTIDKIFVSRLNYISKNFAKEIIISFCENDNIWKSKLEWEHLNPNSIKFSIRKFFYYSSLLLIGPFVYYKLNDDFYSERIVAFLQVRNIDIMLAVAIFIGTLLIFDRYEIKNFEKIGNKSKFYICMEVFILFLSIFSFFLLP